MERLIVRVTDKVKAEMLSKVLKSLDFVSSMEFIEDGATLSDSDRDFFALAGLWENRDVTTQSIRQEAWPKETK
jgi:hypothetical protein